MKFKILTLALLFLPYQLIAQSGEKSGTFDANKIDQLFIRIEAGMNIKILGNNTTSIEYEYEFDGNKEAYEYFFENFDPQYKKSSGRASLAITFPQEKKKNTSYRTKKQNLTIKVPKALELELRSRYSKIEIQSIDRTAQVYNRSGSIYVHNIGQEVRVENEYGNVRAENIKGDTWIFSRSSRIDVKDIQGMLKVKSNYSKVNITDVSGEIDIQNKSGTVNAYDLDSRFTSRGDYSSYELTDIRSDIDISSKSGSISIDKAENVFIDGHYTNVNARNLMGKNGFSMNGKSAKISLDNINGNVSLNGEYLTIILDKISGDTDIINRSGSIKSSSLKGSFDLQGSYNKLELLKYLGNTISIENQNGNVTIEAKNYLRLVKILTSYSHVKLNLETEFDGKVDFDLSYGKLKHPFELSDSQSNSSANETILKGKTGNGNGSMIIHTRNGNITVTQN